MYSVFFDKYVKQADLHKAFVNKFTDLLHGTDTLLESDLRDFVGVWDAYAKSYSFIAADATKRAQLYAPHIPNLCTKAAGEWIDCVYNMGLPGVTRNILVACHLRMSPAEFERVASACEKFTFRAYAVMGRKVSHNRGKIITVANAVLKNGKSDQYVLKNICKWLHDKANAPLSKVLMELGSDRAKYYFDPIMTGWRWCYYFLYEIERIECRNSGIGVIPWGELNTEKMNTIEHIMPKRHRDGSFWASEWPDEAKADRFKHRLGNLVLTNGNSYLGRKAIGLKISDSSSGYDYDRGTASERLVRNFAGAAANEWGEKNILEREKCLLELAVERWAIPCCSDNGIIELPERFNLLNGNAVVEIEIAVPYEECCDVQDESEENENNEEMADDETESDGEDDTQS